MSGPAIAGEALVRPAVREGQAVKDGGRRADRLFPQRGFDVPRSDIAAACSGSGSGAGAQSGVNAVLFDPAPGSCLCLPQHSPLLAAAAALHVADQELDVAGAASITIY